MHRWIKEPLLHFLLLGALLFAVYEVLNRDVVSTQTVRIGAEEVAWLKQRWVRQWQRAPDETELRGLVTDYLRERLLAREARALGLDENDTVVRRRLAQKMKFLVEDTARLAEPDDTVLRDYYMRLAARYQIPATISFTQFFFHDEPSAREALNTVDRDSSAEPGERTLLERDVEQAVAQRVAGQFGPVFAERVFDLPVDQWQGPVESAYGFHLVRVNARQEARAQPFEEVRAQVLEDWYRAEQEKTDAQYFAALLEKYEVVVEDDVKPLIGPLAEAER